MERCFIVSKESEYFKGLEKYIEYAEQQRKFVSKFFEEKGIEATEYKVAGNGLVNRPFNECSKKDITLKIVPSGNDLINFEKMLTKQDERGSSSFRKNSSIAKEFAEKCVSESIVINLFSPRVGDYFNSIGLYGCSYQQFQYNDKLYLKVSSEQLKEDDTPDGFTEIKLSEYYRIKENVAS